MQLKKRKEKVKHFNSVYPNSEVLCIVTTGKRKQVKLEVAQTKVTEDSVNIVG